jgi:glycosyltransferase involved in cell wall biosynthesis
MPRCLLVFEPPDGGVPEHVALLATGLRTRGWETAVVAPPRSIIDDRLEDHGTRNLRMPFQRSYRRPGDDAAVLRQLVRLLRNEPFDLVHCHSAKAGVLGRVAALMARTPVVYTPHCFPFVGPWGPGRRLFARGVERRLGHLTDAVICVSQDERELALRERIANEHGTYLVRNGVKPCAADLAPDPRLAAFARERPTAGCIAVLRHQKGVDLLLEAAPSILRRLPAARLAVVGDGPLRPALEARAHDVGIGQRLRFFEFKPPAARQLQSLDLFVLPSHWEAFPLALLEAMACGVPQVATAVGGTPEAVGDGATGLLCPAGDAETLGEQIASLLADPVRRRAMSEASRERHRRLFGVDRMVQRTAEVYDEVLAKSTKQR